MPIWNPRVNIKVIQTPPPVKFTPGISQIKAFNETKVTVEVKTMRSGSNRHYFMPQFFSADLSSQQGGAGDWPRIQTRKTLINLQVFSPFLGFIHSCQ